MGVITDPIADLLARIRNAKTRKKNRVEVSASKMKKRICEILKEEGYIKNFRLIDDAHNGLIRLNLKYMNNECIISGLKRVSRPGLRRYYGSKELPKVKRGLGIAIVSTSKGVMVDREARKQNVGGEILCEVW